MSNTKLNLSFALRDKGYSNALNTADTPVHRWYFVKEAFSPLIVKEAIDDSQCGQNDLIIDPFCGSGTVPTVAYHEALKATAYEVNPFLAFVAKTKVSYTAPETLQAASNLIEQRCNKGEESHLEGYSTFCERDELEKWLFNREVLRAFEGGWNATSSIDSTAVPFIRLALLGAAMDTCNAKRDGKCLRYRSDWKTLSFGSTEFTDAFRYRIIKIADDLAGIPEAKCTPRIVNDDVRQALTGTITEPFKLCVTSPPYLNSFDYSDVYRPELFLGRFVQTNADLMSLRLKTVRSHIQAKWKSPNESSFGHLYRQSVDQIATRSEDLWDKRLLLMIQAYFEDMKNILNRLRVAARPDASLWLVVSTSAYVGVEIPVDLIIAEIASKVGWYLREVGVLRYLRTTSHHWKKWSEQGEKNPRLRESVVILDASPISRN